MARAVDAILLRWHVIHCN